MNGTQYGRPSTPAQASASACHWLRESDASELKEVVTNALKRVGTRLEMIAPDCLAAVFDQPPRVKEEFVAQEVVELSPACAAWVALRLALAHLLLIDQALIPNIEGLSDGDARALLNDLALSWEPGMLL